MGKARLEAFSDGVIAIIITIMVLELKVPHEPTWHAMLELLPIFFTYALSFVFVGIYWANHHHLLHTVRHVTPAIIWANMFLLFCLSLVPFGTMWLGETHAEPVPTFFYGVLLIACAGASGILQRIVAQQQTNESGKQAHQAVSKRIISSMVGYLIALGLAYLYPLGAIAVWTVIAIIWVVPDRKLETAD